MYEKIYFQYKCKNKSKQAKCKIKKYPQKFPSVNLSIRINDFLPTDKNSKVVQTIKKLKFIYQKA